MACHFHTHKISEKRHNNFPACPMKGSRSWFNMSIRTNGSTYLKTLLVRPKTGLGIRRKKKNSNYKAFYITRKRNKTSYPHQMIK